MENPTRRGPPPPSLPPPNNIIRSGRVPPPRGAPRGCARRARPAARHPTDPPSVKQNTDTGLTGRKKERSKGQRSADGKMPRGLSRCDDWERRNSSGGESSGESFGGSRTSEREHDPRQLAAAFHRESSIASARNLTEDGIDRTVSESPPTEHTQSRKANHDDNYRRKRGHRRRSSMSGSSSGSSPGDDIANNNRHQRKIGSEDVEDGLRTPRENYIRRLKTRTRRGPGSSHRKHRKDSYSPSISSSGGDEGRRTLDRDRHNRHRQQKGLDRSVSYVNDDSSDAESIDFLNVAGRDGHQTSKVRDNHDSPTHTREGQRKARNQTDGKGRRRGRQTRQHSGTDVDSEAEDYGWCNNKYSWDMADAAGLSDESESSANSSQDRVPMHRRVDVDPAEDTGGMRTLKSGRPRGHGSHESDGGDADLRCESSPVANSASSARDLESSQLTTTGSIKPSSSTLEMTAGATAGKPIRGARWGESIGVRSKVFDTATIPTTKVDLKHFLSSPLQSGPGTVLRCFIERNRSGTHKFSHVFSMYADLEDGSGRQLLAARKLLVSKTAYYIICMRQSDLFKDSGKRGGDSFLAKLRASGAPHKEYALYDRGENPASASFDMKGQSDGEEAKAVRNPAEVARAQGLRHAKQQDDGIRRELGVIVYNFDKKEQRTGKRRMEVSIPQVYEQGDSWEQVYWQPCDVKENMKNSFGRIRYQGAQNFLQDDRLLIFHQRESRYDPLSSCLVDFRGRATAPSVKNFQLLKSLPEDNVKRARYFSEGAGKSDCESDDLPRPVYLQMGKVGRDCFNVDVEWPLSLLQAFAICISRFDTHAHF